MVAKKRFATRLSAKRQFKATMQRKSNHFRNLSNIKTAEKTAVCFFVVKQQAIKPRLLKLSNYTTKYLLSQNAQLSIVC